MYITVEITYCKRIFVNFFLTSLFSASSNIIDTYIQGEKDVNGVWKYDDKSPVNFFLWGNRQPDTTLADKYLDMWKNGGYKYWDVVGNASYGYVCEINLK